MKNIRIFIWKLAVFGEKFSVYLNMRVFVMGISFKRKCWYFSHFSEALAMSCHKIRINDCYRMYEWRAKAWTILCACAEWSVHYENMPIQIYWNSVYHQKMKIFRQKKSDIFHVSAQNIVCGHSLEPPRWGGSNEYPQSIFWAEIRKIMYTPVNPSFTV